MSNDTLVGEANVEVIKSLSKKQATARSVVHNIHMKRLNDILASNGLIGAKISADGNCHVTDGTAMLRQEVCNHLMAYKEEYIHFIGDNTLPNNNSLNYLSMKCLIYGKRDIGSLDCQMRRCFA